MNWHELSIKSLTLLYYTMLVGAIYSHLVNGKAPLNGFASAGFLFVAGGLVLLNSAPQDRMRLCLAAVLGFIAEVFGVRYGWLFGNYYYTEILAPNLFGVPLAMGCAWLLLVGYIQNMLAPFKLSKIASIIFLGGWMTVIDLLIDPLAAHEFGYWTWLEQGIYYGIPFRNFVGWFIVSGLIALTDILIFSRSFLPSRAIQNLGFGVIVLYTVCAFGYHLQMAGMVGIVLMILHWVLILRKNVKKAKIN
jgi:uncharacterized membrane protein